MVLSSGKWLDLDVSLLDANPFQNTEINCEPSGIISLEEAEKRHIIVALTAAQWRVSGKGGAAELLQINAKTLDSRMRRLGIRRNKHG